MRRTCGWIIKRFGIAVLVLVFLFPSLEAASASQEKFREYLEEIWNISEIADLTDTTLQGILQETYQGVPYLEWVQLFRCGDEVYGLMAQGRDPDALRIALGYGIESTYVEVLTELGMPGAAAVAKLSARVVQYTLEKFNEAFRENAFETQLDMYFLARDRGYSFEDVVSRKEGGGIRGPLVTFTDDGWLKAVEDDECRFCRVQPYTPVEFYVIAEAAYTTRTMESSYKDDKKEIKKALYSVINAQQETWAYSYRMSGFDTAYSVQPTADGGYIVSGGLTPTAVVGSDSEEDLPSLELVKPWILKLDTNGGVVWAKSFGEPGLCVYDIHQTPEGDYIAAGIAGDIQEMMDEPSPESDVWIAKLDPQGNLKWQKTYDITGFDRAWTVQQTSDGGYIAGGRTDFLGAYGADVWLLKLNTKGEVEWQKVYGNGEFQAMGLPYNVCLTKDGGYIFASTTTSPEEEVTGEQVCWVVKLDSTGNILWQRGYGDKRYSFYDPAFVRSSPDGSCIVVCNATGEGKDALPHRNLWVLKLDFNGNLLWQRAYGISNGDCFPLPNGFGGLENGKYTIYAAQSGSDPALLFLSLDISSGEILSQWMYKSEMSFMPWAGCRAAAGRDVIAGACLLPDPLMARPGIVNLSALEGKSIPCLLKQPIFLTTRETQGVAVNTSMSPVTTTAKSRDLNLEVVDIVPERADFCEWELPSQSEEYRPEQEEPEPVLKEPVLVLDNLTRKNVAGFLSQHPEGGKYWFHITLAWDTPSSSKIQSVFDNLTEQGYINHYSLSQPLFDQIIVVETITQKGSRYLKDLSEAGILGQSVDVALCAKKDIRVTGIQKEGNKARVEYIWTCGKTTPVFDLLRPILTSYNFQWNLDTGLKRVLELLDSPEIPGQAFFALYDDGWRLKEVWDDTELGWWTGS